MISDEPLSVSLEEAIENQLLRSGNPAWVDGSEDAAEDYWRAVERNVAAEDYTPLLALVAELRDKIIGLTPRRRDLAVETCEAMDVELLQQMMTYGAFDVVRVSSRLRLVKSWKRLASIGTPGDREHCSQRSMRDQANLRDGGTVDGLWGNLRPPRKTPAEHRTTCCF